MLQLFDTAKGAVVPFEPAVEGKVSMYVCGPTVYGPPHLGHGRFALVFDVLRRYLIWSGHDVTYVSNITDIDDKIIERANDEGRSTTEVSADYERLWWEVMDAINVMAPDHDPHATAYVDEMVTLIAELVAAGAAYETDDGVYFAPASVDDYGLLARQSIEHLVAGARVEVDDEKRSPIDFALWKKAKPGEPSWDSPWGPGRPGWHTECVVMSLDLLGEGFDIHGGGQDLAFPHHENERAQAVADGRMFARHWVHNGFIEVDGEKMSKSLGNFTNLVDLIESTDPRAFRLLVLRSRYRGPLEVTRANTDDASSALDRLDAFARRTRDLTGGLSPGERRTVADTGALQSFAEAMDADLNTPEAVSLLFTLVGSTNAALDSGDTAAAIPMAAAAHEIADALGLVLAADDPDSELPPSIHELVTARDLARSEKNWAEADRLRDELQSAGYAIEDSPDGTRVRPT